MAGAAVTPAEVGALVTAACGLCVSLAQLFTAIATHIAVTNAAVKVAKIESSTNGELDHHKEVIAALKAQQATPAELDARRAGGDA